MTKKKKFLNDLIENYLPTDDAIMMAVNSRVVNGWLVTCIFYDKHQKMFLAVDMNEVSDYQTKSEKKLREKIFKNPQRFIKFPQFTSQDQWDIMVAFAEEKGDKKLLKALHGYGAFSAFYGEINSRKLDVEFGEFQANYFNEIFKEWCEDNHISEKIQF